MKKNILLLLLLIGALSSCTSAADSLSDIKLTISSEQSVSWDVSTLEYQPSENSDWTVTTEDTWINFTSIIGDANDSVTVNITTESEASEGEFIIRYNSGSVETVRVLRTKDVQDRVSRDIAVMSLNLWNEGKPVGSGGYDAIVNEIAHHYSDFVMLCEIRNYSNTDFIDKLLASLREKGVEYYAENKCDDVSILSKYPITSSGSPLPEEVFSITTEIESVKFKLYSMHLDFRNYTAYLPRGLDGTNGTNVETLPEPVSDLAVIQAMNLASNRDDAIKISIEDAKADVEAGTVVIMAGDFNEPSHLDWGVPTKDLYDHNGVAYNWDVSMMMQDAGYIDSYREIYKSAVTHPGFTYPSFQARAKYNMDIRDRIDFIYYHPNVKLKLLESSVYGPLESRVKTENIAEDTDDPFILPLDLWPTDHKGVISRFKLYLD